MPDDLSMAVQLTANKPEMTICENIKTYKIPKERDAFWGHLERIGDVVYYEDTIAHLPPDIKELTDSLIPFLIELRNNFRQKKDFVMAGKITERLRVMGVVLMDRLETAHWRPARSEK